jgi:glycosyltransferase involved in cell wall biosynthesis
LTKLLYIADHGSTGFGVVSKGILSGLHATGEYEILQLGINYNDYYGHPGVPWTVIPAGFYHPVNGVMEAADPYGHLKLEQYLKVFDPDIVFINNDFPVGADYMRSTKGNKPTALAKHRSVKILYAPMDSWPFPPIFDEYASYFDQVIAYSQFQKDMMVQRDKKWADVPVVYHGVDTDTYFPIEKKLAKQMVMETFAKFGADKVPDLLNSFLVYFVGTNQWRKDLPTLFRAFVKFNEQYPKAFLIPHTSAMPMGPTNGGWALYNLRDLTGLKHSVLFKDANIFSPTEMNYFYNAADVLAYPTRGEGYGLPSIEAMATKTPVIATQFGPQEELHADGRGFYIEVDGYEVGQRGAYTYYARPKWQSLAERLAFVHDNPEVANVVAERAYEWAVTQTWESKALEMHEIIQKCLPLLNRRSTSKSTRARRKKN